MGLEPALVPVIEPGLEVAVHCVTVEPPLLELGVKATETEEAETIVGVPIVGGKGTPIGVIAGLDAVEAGLGPTAFVQVTVNV